MKRAMQVAVVLAALFLTAAIWLWVQNTQDESPLAAPQAANTASPELIARGAYLARVGNCAGCHTTRGGAAYAGGLGINTPFGAVYASNLTPDLASGIGSWSAHDFWRAMHNGKSKSGRLLYPAFPYTNTTLMSRVDSDALFAFLGSLAAVPQPNTPHTVRFPYNSQMALAVWRALYFKPGVYQPDAAQTAEFNRGAYLVGGLGHCSACHAARNALGATAGPDLAGGLIPLQNWYAPSLVASAEAGLGDWAIDDIKTLFKTGTSANASVIGPMAEVVLGSTQHWSNADLAAMAVYLKALGNAPTSAKAAAEPAPPMTSAGPTFQPPEVPKSFVGQGAKLYEEHCAQCHGADGMGQRVGNQLAYPALKGNRAVVMPQTTNLVQIVLNGGYAPATTGNPRPFGMPPYVLTLNDTEIASVLSHIRSAWGNQGSGVSALDVNRVRAHPGQ
jgi:mono/diheme cytochrome c family protein